jgi:ubiquinone biosynthesis monooxygenase Coq7
MQERHLSAFDHLLGGIDSALRTFASGSSAASRPNPASGVKENPLSRREVAHSAALMRVNHAGEIAAQGLYQGHAAVARDRDIEQQMSAAAVEELDHLGWCSERLAELGSRPSWLSPFWYAGAFAIGAASGVLGDRWSLGFIAETERQVSEHLGGHLEKLPKKDARSRAIVRQMRTEEEHHGTNAQRAGAAALPHPVRRLMQFGARIMTRTAYWI